MLAYSFSRWAKSLSFEWFFISRKKTEPPTTWTDLETIMHTSRPQYVNSLTNKPIQTVNRLFLDIR